MRLINFVLLAAAAVSAGCATATRGENEQVTFVSTPPGAKMETTTGLICTTPCTLEVPRRDTFTAKFTLGDQVEQIFVDTEIPDSVAATTAANVLFTPIILIPAAIAIDAASGANLNHTPNPVVVTFKTIEAREEDIADADSSAEVDAELPGDRTFKLDNTAGPASTGAVAATAPSEPEPEAEKAIWVNVTVDAAVNTFYTVCTHFSGLENKLPLDGSEDWHPIRLSQDPGLQLYARVRTTAGQPGIEFWQRANDAPESKAFRVALPSLEPGTSAETHTRQRAVEPYNVCGDYTIYVDVVPAPAQQN